MAVTLRRSDSTQRVAATCPAGASIGDMVFIAGEKVAGLYTVDLCNIDQEEKRPFGMVITKETSTRCTVQNGGFISGIYTGLVPGRFLFLGTGEGSRLIPNPPGYPTTGVRFHQKAGQVIAADELYLDLYPPVAILPS